MNRRGFLAGILAGTAAPSIVRSESLMRLWVPPQGVWHRGGICPYPIESFDTSHFDLESVKRRIVDSGDFYRGTLAIFVVHDDVIKASSFIGNALPFTILTEDMSSHTFRGVANRGESVKPGRTK